MNFKLYADMAAIKDNADDYLGEGYFWPVSENEFEDAVNYHDQAKARDHGSDDASLNNFVQ